MVTGAGLARWRGMNNLKRSLTAAVLVAAFLSVASAASAAPADGLLDIVNGGPGVAGRGTLGSAVDTLLGTSNAPGTTAPGSIGNDVDCILGDCGNGRGHLLGR